MCYKFPKWLEIQTKRIINKREDTAKITCPNLRKFIYLTEK